MIFMNILILALVLGGIFIVLGFYFKKRALFASIGGSMIYVIIGILLLGQGLSFVSGSTHNVSGNVTTVTNDYSNVQDNTSDMIGWVVMLTGFAGFVGGAMGLNKLRFDDDEIDDDGLKQ